MIHSSSARRPVAIRIQERTPSGVPATEVELRWSSARVKAVSAVGNSHPGSRGCKRGSSKLDLCIESSGASMVPSLIHQDQTKPSARVTSGNRGLAVMVRREAASIAGVAPGCAAGPKTRRLRRVSNVGLGKRSALNCTTASGMDCRDRRRRRRSVNLFSPSCPNSCHAHLRTTHYSVSRSTHFDVRRIACDRRLPSRILPRACLLY